MNKEIANRQHIEAEKEYEWWYFDFVDPNGVAVNIVLHASDLFGRKRKSYYSASFLSQGGVGQHLRGEKQDFRISRGEFLKDDGGLFQEEGKFIRFNLPFEKDTQIEGKIEKTPLPLFIEGGILYETALGVGMWLPTILGGEFEIRITEGKSERFLSGFAYHDHQWGNLPIQDYISDWVWGHFDSQQKSLVFFKVLTNGGAVINRYYVRRHLEIAGGAENVKTSLLEEIATYKNPMEAHFGVNLAVPGEALTFMIEKRSIMRKREEEKAGDKLFSYLRWHVGNGIVEYMRFR